MTKKLCRNLAVAMSMAVVLSGLSGCQSSGGGNSATAAPAATKAVADGGSQAAGDSVIKEKRDIVIIDAGGEQDMFGEL